MQASAKQQGFLQAFPIALDAYRVSTVMDDVITAIGAVPEGSHLLEEQLSNIITKHPIRMWLLFQCQQLCSWAGLIL